MSVEPLLVSLFGVAFFAYRPTMYDAVGYALAALGAAALAVTYARAPPAAGAADEYSRLDVAPADGPGNDSELLLPKSRNGHHEGSAC